MTKIKVQDGQWVSSQTHWILEQWARWARVNPDFALGYPNATPFRRLLGSTVSSSLISDDDAMVVDTMVAKLQQRHPEMGKAVALYYLGTCNVSRVARAMGIYHSKADSLIKSGTAWLDAALGMPEAA